MRRVVLFLALAAAACGGGGNTGDDVPDGAPGQADAPPGQADAAITVTCSGKSPLPLDDTWMVPWNNVDRRVLVHVPASYDPTHATPVVLGFHGYTFSAD